MRLITTVLIAAGLVAAPAAMAGTVQEMTTKGAVLSIAGFDIDMTFTPDGKFTAMDGAMTGTWRIDGEKLCTTGADGKETCLAYPVDKKSGDKFEITTPEGLPVTVTIK
jgi:hypothetical protein